MELFAKIINGFYWLTIFCKKLHLSCWTRTWYASGILKHTDSCLFLPAARNVLRNYCSKEFPKFPKKYLRLSAIFQKFVTLWKCTPLLTSSWEFSKSLRKTEAATGGVLKKVFLKISQNSQEDTCARVSFLIKLQASGLRLY